MVNAQITIENNAEIEVDLLGLDVLSDYNFNIDTCISNGNLTCKKCINKVVTYKSTCAYCEFVVTGPKEGGTAVIFYTEENVPKVASLSVGEKVVLPRGIKITSVAVDNGVNVSSSCPSFEDAVNNTESFICAEVLFSMDTDSANQTNAWDVLETSLDQIGFNNATYLLTIANTPLVSHDATEVAASLTNALPEGVIQYANFLGIGNISNRANFKILLKVPQSALSTLFVAFQPAGGDNSKARLYFKECTESCCPANSLT